MNHQETPSDINFAYKVRHALNEQMDNIPSETISKLAAARQLAMSKKKADVPARILVSAHVLAGSAGGFFSQPLSWLTRLGVAAPILAGIVMFSGLYQYEQQHQTKDLATIDAAVLADEVPPSAYLDGGFNAYLAQNTTQQNQ